MWVCISACEIGNQTHLKWHVKLTLTLPSKYISTFIQGMFASSGAHQHGQIKIIIHGMRHHGIKKKSSFFMVEFTGWFFCLFVIWCKIIFCLNVNEAIFGRVIEMIEMKLQANSQQTFSEVYKFLWNNLHANIMLT